MTRGPFGGRGARPGRDRRRRARKRLRPLLAAGRAAGGAGLPGRRTRPRTDDPPALTTLGRGGTDLTATLMGRALGASRVTLWKDVPGLLTADPARGARRAHHPPAERARGGRAGLLRRQGAAPARADPAGRPGRSRCSSGRSPIRRRRARRSPPATRWTSTRSRRCRRISAQALVTVAGRGLIGVPGVAGRTFATLSDARDVGLADHPVVVASSPSASPSPRRRRAPPRSTWSAPSPPEIARREVDSVQVEPGMSTVAVVGLGMAGTPGIAARVFTALAAANINLVAIAQGSSELNISFVVKASEAAVAQRAIHQAFQLSKIGGGRVTHTADGGRGAAGLRPDRPHAGWPAGQAQGRRTGRRRAGGGGGRPQRLRVRSPRPARPRAERAGQLEAAGQAVLHGAGRAGAARRWRRWASSPATPWPVRCWSTSPPTRPDRCCWPA